MSSKNMYWMTQARSGLVVLIGAAPAVFSFRDGNETLGYVCVAATLILAVLAYLLVDRKNVRDLPDGAGT